MASSGIEGSLRIYVQCGWGGYRRVVTLRTTCFHMRPSACGRLAFSLLLPLSNSGAVAARMCSGAPPAGRSATEVAADEMTEGVELFEPRVQRANVPRSVSGDSCSTSAARALPLPL